MEDNNLKRALLINANEVDINPLMYSFRDYNYEIFYSNPALINIEDKSHGNFLNQIEKLIKEITPSELYYFIPISKDPHQEIERLEKFLEALAKVDEYAVIKLYIAFHYFGKDIMAKYLAIVHKHRLHNNLFIVTGIFGVNPLKGENSFFSTLNVFKEVHKTVAGELRMIYVKELSVEQSWNSINYNIKSMIQAMQSESAMDYNLNLGAILTLREFLKSCFMFLGVEIEFSGKGERERGVVIDVDEDRLQYLGLSTDYMRLGQTVVKVDSAEDNNDTYEFLEDIFFNVEYSEFDIESIIEETANIALSSVKES